MKARALTENGDRQKTHSWQVISEQCCIDIATMVILAAIFFKTEQKREPLSTLCFSYLS